VGCRFCLLAVSSHREPFLHVIGRMCSLQLLLMMIPILSGQGPPHDLI
jgi:hypothetical protein